MSALKVLLILAGWWILAGGVGLFLGKMIARSDFEKFIKKGRRTK